MRNRKVVTKSPIKAGTLQNPGESIGLEIRRLLVEEVTFYIYIAAIFIFLAVQEWIKWFLKSPPFPLILTALAGVVTIYSTFKVRQIKRQLRDLRQGREGEKAVGQYLEGMRIKGYQVIHDIPSGENFNIDHVLIGETGIYAIETKTISKPAKGRAYVDYDGKKITINGFVPDRDPIVQAKASARWLRDLLKESTGRDLNVRGVVLYPGWYTSRQPRDAEVWVLNPKSLPAFVDHEKRVISPEDVHLFTYHLGRYIRHNNKPGKSN